MTDLIGQFQHKLKFYTELIGFIGLGLGRVDPDTEAA